MSPRRPTTLYPFGAPINSASLASPRGVSDATRQSYETEAEDEESESPVPVTAPFAQ